MTWQEHGVAWFFILVLFCVVKLSSSSIGYAQSFPEQEEGVDGKPPSGDPATRIVPSLRLAERYDSNVYFVPGGKFDDYVTTVSPQVKVFHENKLVKGLLGGGLITEIYAKNPGLNYLGGNGIVNLDLDRAMGSLVKGLGLHVSDIVNYTPQPPAFAAPVGGGQLPEPLVQGLQARRANSFTNVGRAQVSYLFSPFVGITSTFIDKRVRFGRSTSTPAGIEQEGFKDLTFQTLISGPMVKISDADTISISHSYLRGSFSEPDREDGSFFTHGANAGWTRLLAEEFQVSVEAGFAVMGGSGKMYPVGSASVDWAGQYTSVQISYSRTIAPSFLAFSTPLLGNAVTVVVRRELAEPLSLAVRGSYAVNESIPDGSLVRFESYLVEPSLEYKLGKTFTVRLSYSHSQFQRGFVGRSSDFDRDVVALNVLSEWR